jgi:hypothetical protein
MPANLRSVSLNDRTFHRNLRDSGRTGIIDSDDEDEGELI